MIEKLTERIAAWRATWRAVERDRQYTNPELFETDRADVAKAEDAARALVADLRRLADAIEREADHVYDWLNDWPESGESAAEVRVVESVVTARVVESGIRPILSMLYLDENGNLVEERLNDDDDGTE